MDNHFSHMIDVLNDGIFYMNDRDNVCFYNPSSILDLGLPLVILTLASG